MHGDISISAIVSVCDSVFLSDDLIMQLTNLSNEIKKPLISKINGSVINDSQYFVLFIRIRNIDIKEFVEHDPDHL